ncbi:hypothetical protein BDZ89DRAFT_1080620 [Hymenopellis radicata]|nr:hypothetical protein BDZ89DRAFT_1080620 [Hymenopellis radicata]
MIWTSKRPVSSRKSSFDSARRRNSATSTTSTTASTSKLPFSPENPPYSPTLARKPSHPMSDPIRRPSLSAVTPNANLPPPPNSSPAAFKSYSHADLYTVNSLNSFSFGNAHSGGSVSASPVSPLDDSTDDDSIAAFDVTPRPSVVDNPQPVVSSRRSHSSQNSPGPSRRKRSPSTASHHTFGTSSASASASIASLSDGIEFDDYMYYSDEERIEISSVMYDGSTIDIEDRHLALASGYGERRVSLPIAVPERDREGSILTLRRPSKSLDGESPLTLPTVNPNEPNSVPESDGDWKSLRARKGKAKESPTHPTPAPITLVTAPPITQDFDLDWSDITRGITSFDQPTFAAQSESRRGSSNSIFPWGRRPSTATTASIFSTEDPFFRAVKYWAPDYRDQSRAWTFARERADGAGPSPTSPTSKKGRNSSGDSSKFGLSSTTSHRGEKEAWRHPTNWKGMPIGLQEIWANELVGRFKVDRRSIKQEENSEKSPAQRLVVDHFRDGFTRGNAKHDDPCVMVHKHSKTVAFSVSRFYRGPGGRRSMASNMILLAPRKVQEAFTSTTSTRKLESHGLLEDDRSKRRERGYSSARKKPFDPQSSGGSVASTSRPTSSSGPAPPRRVRRPSWDSDEETVPPRTPHSEAYGTVDAAQLDQLRQHNQVHGSDDTSSFLSRLLFRSRRSELPAQRMVVYDPVWVTLEPRNKQEQTQRVVENLNHSFQEVGLLQVNKPRAKGKDRDKEKGRRREAVGNEGWVELFREVPDEVLFMLIPLWPSETDPVTADTEDFVMPPVERQYLLVCYKPNPPASTPPTPKRISPTSSHESKKDDEKDILLTGFNMTGRLVSHKDIQGSGMRVSEGITVNGSLQEAFEKMPPISSNTTTELIGICRNREAGVEFIPDGLVNLGLCMMYNAYPPGTIAEEAEDKLTPVGRAVVQTAWVGGLALLSFGPQTFSRT